MGCYCDTAVSRVVADIIAETIPEDSLVNGCCWKHICRARGLKAGRIDAETWSELNRRRGYLLARQNPRGF